MAKQQHHSAERDGEPDTSRARSAGQRDGADLVGDGAEGVPRPDDGWTVGRFTDSAWSVFGWHSGALQPIFWFISIGACLKLADAMQAILVPPGG